MGGGVGGGLYETKIFQNTAGLAASLLEVFLSQIPEVNCKSPGLWKLSRRKGDSIRFSPESAGPKRRYGMLILTAYT